MQNVPMGFRLNNIFRVHDKDSPSIFFLVHRAKNICFNRFRILNALLKKCILIFSFDNICDK